MSDSESEHEEPGSDWENDGFRGFSRVEWIGIQEEEMEENSLVSVMDAAVVPPNQTIDPPVVAPSQTIDSPVVPHNTSLQVFDDDLPLEHSYLGNNLEVLSGRIILSEGSRVWIALLPRFYGALVPGQTLPLTVRDNFSMEMLRNCIFTNRTFGCVAKSYNRGVGLTGPQYGTTVEIYEFADNSDSINVKAKARQRFKLSKTKRSEGGYMMGYVEILPEIILPNPLCLIQALGRYRRTRRQWCRRQEALLTVWPSWVYDMYDADKLVDRVHKDLAYLNQGLRKESGKGEIMPQDVTQLSFWVGTHVDIEERIFHITLNSPIQRLRWQLSTMTKHQDYLCGSCEGEVATQNEVFAMSTEGAQSTYVNPLGTVHDTLTFRKVKNVTLTSQPSTEYSWFPGYAWSIGVCSACRKHLGWRFTAVNKKTVPNVFYGLTRSGLKVKINFTGVEFSV